MPKHKSHTGASKHGSHRKAAHHAISKTKFRTKDVDQCWEDLLPEKAARLANQPIDPDLPGLGQHYCISCARYFINAIVHGEHNATKEHKRRLKKLLTEVPYGIKPEEYYGMPVDNRRPNKEILPHQPVN